MQINSIGYNVIKPTYNRNYPIFNEERVNDIAKNGEKALPTLNYVLQNAQYETQIIETLYILNRMIDNGTKGVESLYPTLSRFNDTNSPDIQVLLAGIYRKTLIPDAFGPLNKMLLRQTFYPNSPYFDPTEEIGGAILEYLTKYGKINIDKGQSK